jgi:predicted acyltransferase
MPGFPLGGALGLLIASSLGLDAGAAWVLAAVCALLGYLGWCAAFPIVKCRWCKGREFITDGRGGMRQRPCWRCKRKRLIRRPGARLIGARGRRE